MPRDNTPHISHHISLEDFTPHSLPRETENGGDQGPNGASESHDDFEEASYYTHPCRCSGEFVITHMDLEEGVEIVGCEGCGEWVRVGYEVVEEDEGEAEKLENQASQS